jgi:hypothetical protein
MDVGVHSSASREGGRGAGVRARGVELRNRVASAGGGRLDRSGSQRMKEEIEFDDVARPIAY